MMCVSYLGINEVTKFYEYPIPRCDTAITIFQIGSSGIYFVIMDTKQGCHHIAVREYDVEKLTFFGPDHKKYGSTVTPFGPVNAPSFYMCMMENFKSAWGALFIQMVQDLE